MDEYFLYEFTKTEWHKNELLLRVAKEDSDPKDDDAGELAVIQMNRKRDAMLRRVWKENNYKRFRLLGCFMNIPWGKELLEAHGGRVINLWFTRTASGPTRIVLSQAETEKEFYDWLEADGVLYALGPIYPAERVQALFHTENDFLLEEEQIQERATKELEGLYNDSEEACMRLYRKKRFLQDFLEDGWSFDQVYEILDTENQEELKAWYHNREDQPEITVRYEPIYQSLSISMKPYLPMSKQINFELRFDCSENRHFFRILESLLYYRDCFEYDMSGRMYGYEKMLQVLSEQGIETETRG